MSVDPNGARDAAAHLARLDDAVPGLIVGLHVIGSAVLDDYHPGTSDLDLVAETAHPVDGAELAAIAAAHQGAGFGVETVYVAAGSDFAPAPWVRDGVAHEEASGDLHAVARLQLAAYSATLRGERPGLAADVPAARAYCRANLESYWAPELTGAASRLAARAPAEPYHPEPVMWVGLGPARLWHTIRTGEVVSKSRAGELAADAWPDLAEPMRDILAVRAGKEIELTVRHAVAAVALGNQIITHHREN